MRRRMLGLGFTFKDRTQEFKNFLEPARERERNSQKGSDDHLHEKADIAGIQIRVGLRRNKETGQNQEDISGSQNT